MILGCQLGPLPSVTEMEIDTSTVPGRIYEISEVGQDTKGGLWMSLEDSLAVSGTIVRRFSDGMLMEEFQVVEGRQSGLRQVYFPGSELKFLETYEKGKLNGEVRRWTMANGYSLIAHLNYKDGKLDGEQRKWYDTGELHKKMNIENGRESGLQQAFRKNGALYANYEARDGKIFGMKRSTLCYELKDEAIISGL